jgi:hypothetical protein
VTPKGESDDPQVVVTSGFDRGAGAHGAASAEDLQGYKVKLVGWSGDQTANWATG